MLNLFNDFKNPPWQEVNAISKQTTQSENMIWACIVKTLYIVIYMFMLLYFFVYTVYTVSYDVDSLYEQ